MLGSKNPAISTKAAALAALTLIVLATVFAVAFMPGALGAQRVTTSEAYTSSSAFATTMSSTSSSSSSTTVGVSSTPITSSSASTSTAALASSSFSSSEATTTRTSTALSSTMSSSTRSITANCSDTSTGQTPLTDLASGLYEGYEGGLYPGGSNTMPPSHLSDGLALAQQVMPLDPNGNVSTTSGKVVLLTVGMSNNVLISDTLIQLIGQNRSLASSLNQNLVIVNGAQGGMTAYALANPTSPQGSSYWNTWVEQQLEAKGVDDAQVQIVWLYDADANPKGSDIAYATTLSSEFQTILQIMHTRYPNLKLVYMSSREYGGYASTSLNPEPYAYASGFAVKWTIGAQLNGSSVLNYNSTRGPVEAPWVAWGPYTWADGLKPRSDGLTYSCSDFHPDDGTHPSAQGATKIADQLLRFFETDPTAKSWFLR
jgi:hypothetical protein